jgi:hypothetical protein
MSEDITKRFEGGSPFERRVIAEFAALRGEIAVMRTQQAAMARNIASLDGRVTSIDQRLISLEERVDMRLKETRPIWEAVKEKIDRLDEKFTLFIRDLYDIRGDVSRDRKRLDILERRVLS